MVLSQVEVIDGASAKKVAEAAEVLTNAALTLTVTDIIITAQLLRKVVSVRVPEQHAQVGAVSLSFGALASLKH